MKQDFLLSIINSYHQWADKTDQTIVSAFCPNVFRRLGYDHSLKSPSELHKFAGGMHFLSDDELIDTIGFVSLEEYNLLEIITKAMAKLNKAHQDKYFSDNSRELSSMLCITSLCRSLIPLRILKKLYPNPSLDDHFLEIGPGSGYFGLMAVLSGYNIISTDVSLGFFSFQAYIYSEILKQDYLFYDFVSPPPQINSKARLLHIPVWIWANEQFKLPENTKCVISNHVLNEMNRHALLYLLKKLEESGMSKTKFIIEGWGYGSRTNSDIHKQTQKIFRYHGYNIIDEYAKPNMHVINILQKTVPTRLENLQGLIQRPVSEQTEQTIVQDQILPFNGKLLEFLEDIMKSTADALEDHNVPYNLRKTFESECGVKYKRYGESFLEYLDINEHRTSVYFKNLPKGHYI